MSKVKGRPRLYNWNVEVGESFEVIGKRSSSIRTLASCTGKKLGRKYSCKTSNDTVTVTRKL